MTKIRAKYLFFFILLRFNPALAQNDTLHTIQINTTITPGNSYKVIELENIDAHTTENLGDLLSKETPIYIKSYGPGSLATISIRGSGASHTQLYWNGIAINSPTLGQLDLATLPVAFVDNAEIHLGASSIIDGSGGLGGAIQLNNSANYNNKINADFRKELGSFGTDKTQFSVRLGNKKFQSKTSLFRNLAVNNFTYKDISQKEAPYLKRENSEVIQYGFRQDLYFKPNAKHEFSIKSNYLDSYRQIPSVIGVPSKGEHQTDNTLRLLGEWKYFNNKNFHHLRLAFIQDASNYVDSSTSINSLVKIKSYKGTYNYKHYFSDSIKLTAQINAGSDVANSAGFDTLRAQVRQSIFVQFEHKTKWNLIYNLAIRQEVIDAKLTPLIPTLGIKYYLSKNKKLNINANLARNFKAPSLNELYWSPGGNINLLSEIGFTTEMGLNYQANKIKISFTPYYSLIDNWIQWLPTQSGFWSPVNVKKVENKGFELNLKKEFQLTKKIKLNIHTGYNFVSSINTSTSLKSDNTLSKQLIYVPKHNFNISVKISLKKWTFAYNQTLTGQVFIDANNTTYMPYYAPADINFSMRMIGKNNQKTADIGLKISNIYNEDYQIIANRPLPGRWFLVFVKFNLSANEK